MRLQLIIINFHIVSFSQDPVKCWQAIIICHLCVAMHNRVQHMFAYKRVTLTNIGAIIFRNYIISTATMQSFILFCYQAIET